MKNKDLLYMYIGKGSERQLVSMKSNSRGLVVFSWQLLQSHFFQNRRLFGAELALLLSPIASNLYNLISQSECEA